MTAHIPVEVDTQAQANTLAVGLRRRDVLHFVLMMGALDGLPHDVARMRILTFLTDYAADPDNKRVNRFAPIGKQE